VPSHIELATTFPDRVGVLPRRRRAQSGPAFGRVFTTRLISSIEVAIEGPMMNARRSSGKRCAVPVLKLVGRDVLAGW